MSVNVPGAVLNVEMRGDESSTVFVHGFAGDLGTWDALWPLLPEDRNLLRYDLRGFGRSVATDDERFSHADDLLTLIDVMALVKVDLVGLSMGGSIALNLALSHPGRVRSLVLLSPGLTAWNWSEQWRSQWRDITRHAQRGDMAAAKTLWRAHPLFATVTDAASRRLLDDEVERYRGRQWVCDRQAAALPDVDRLAALAPPLLLLTGTRDLPDFRLIADVIEALAPTVVRHDAVGVGHMLQLEAPEWCRERIIGFWSALDAGRPDGLAVSPLSPPGAGLSPP